MQFQADILGVPVQRPVVTDMAALGAAYMAGLAVGFWEDTDQLVEQWKVDRTFEPTMPDEKRQELYNGWKRAVERSLGWARKE
jgi:glycerol kinase